MLFYVHNGVIILDKRLESEIFLTEKQIKILSKLYENAKEVNVKSIEKSQRELANEFGITRQALSIHLRKFRELGLIRTGRGFIDITEKALKILKGKTNDSFVIIKVQPQKRTQVYEHLNKIFHLQKAYRVTGEIDVIAIVNQQSLDEFLREISKIDGITSTSAHIIISQIK